MTEGYKKLRLEQTVVPTAQGTLAKSYRLTFMLGDDGPFSEDFSEAEFIPEKIRARVQSVAQTIRGLS